MNFVVLLDTNIPSFAFRNDPRLEQYTDHLVDRLLAISFMTVAELYQWGAVRNWGEKRLEQMEAALERYVQLDVDRETCRLWGDVRARRRAKGRPISAQDAWIAATAIRYGIPLVTDDVDDFGYLDDLTVLGPLGDRGP